MGAFLSSDLQKYQDRYTADHKRLNEDYMVMTSKSPKPRSKNTIRAENPAIWSIEVYNGDNPAPRTGHCMAYDAENDIAFVAYGIDQEERLLNDFWKADFKKQRWIRLNVDPFLTLPRTGCRAVLVGEELWIFGGARDSMFLDDLHVVNTRDLTVTRPQTTGKAPEPCVNHHMFYYDGKILLYGGSSISVLNQLSVLDIETLTWSTLEVTQGRSLAAWTLNNNIPYVYGAANAPGMLKFTFSAEEPAVISGRGSAPNYRITGASMVSCGEYILFLGGDPDPETNNHMAPLYLYSTITDVWSILNTRPDGITATVYDGEVDNNGVFMLPMCAKSSAIYRKSEREVRVFLGYPQTNRTAFFTFKVGDALSIIRQREDMLKMLDFS